MKKKLKFLFFVILSGTLSLILAIAILIYMNAARYPISGWNDLEHSLKRMNDSIKDIAITRVIPIQITIRFLMKEDFQYDEVEPLFEKMKDAVETKAFYEELQQLHIKQKKHPFARLKVEFFYTADGRAHTRCEYLTAAPQVNSELASYAGLMEWSKSCSTSAPESEDGRQVQ